MAAGAAGTARAAAWQRVPAGDDAVAVAERAALGTSARVVVWPPGNLDPACAAVNDVLAALDLQASRFRPDSELSWLNAARGGLFLLGDGLAEAVGVALAAARWTGGLTDPTVGDALVSLGYDRDFAAIGEDGEPLGAAVPAPGWHLVRLDGPLLRLPPGIRLDLGATAKGVGADRAVRAVMSANGSAGGVLVSLGGDIAVAGTPPRDGWPVTVAEEPDPDGAPRGQRGGQLVRLPAGAVATSLVTVRHWRRGGAALHHIVDPRTGRPADGPWRTATVAAATCADANAASTAAIVAGARAGEWLAATGLPTRLTGHDGRICDLNGWPACAGAAVPALGGQPGVRRGPAMSAVLGGSQALWFVSRASGLAVLAAFSAAVVAGVAARLGPGPARLAAGELHRTLALFCVAFLGLHVVTAILDPYVRIGWAATVLPLASPYRTLAIGLGALAVDLGGAVLVTSLVRQRLGYRAWRAVHWLAYLAWPAAFGHAVTAGNDVRIWWAALVLWGCTAAVGTAVIARLLSWLRGPGLPDRAVPAEGALR